MILIAATPGAWVLQRKLDYIYIYIIYIHYIYILYNIPLIYRNSAKFLMGLVGLRVEPVVFGISVEMNSVTWRKPTTRMAVMAGPGWEPLKTPMGSLWGTSFNIFNMENQGKSPFLIGESLWIINHWAIFDGKWPIRNRWFTFEIL